MKQVVWGVVLPALIFTVIPAFAQGDFQKGISYYKQGQYAKAVQEFEQIVEENPGYEAGYRVLGDCYLKLKKYPDAARAFHKSIELDDTQFVSYRGAAVAEFNSRRFQEAVATLLRGEKAARLAKERYQLFQLRGSAYYNLGRFSEARSDLEQAVSIQRGNPDDLLQLGISQYQLREYREARATLKQVIALQPDSDEARKFLSRLDYQDGLAAIRNGEYSEAVPLLTAYIGEYPQDGEGWFNLGLAQLFSGDLDKAQISLQQSAQLLPNNWETYDRLGFIFEKKGQFQASLQNYQRAFSLNSDASIRGSVERVQERIRRQQAGNS